MANGLLGKAMSSISTDVLVYTVPAAANFATVSVNMTNTGIEDAKVRLALTTASTPGMADYVEYEAIIPASGGSLERSCMVLSPGEKIMVWSDKSTVAIRAYGLEEIPV